MAESRAAATFPDPRSRRVVHAGAGSPARSRATAETGRSVSVTGPGQRRPGLEWSGRVAEDDPLAGSDELWADEDFAPPKLQPVFVPRPDSVAFGRGFLLAAAVSLVLWLAAAAICFAAYRLIA